MWWNYSANVLYIEHFCNTFSTKKDGGRLSAAPFCDSSWWGSCYFDRNILPVLALTTLVVKFIWILLPCHFFIVANLSRLVGEKRKEFIRAIMPASCWQGDAQTSSYFYTASARAVRLQTEITDTLSLNVVSHESILIKSVTPLTSSIIWANSCSLLCNIYVSDFGLTKKLKLHEIELLRKPFLSLLLRPPFLPFHLPVHH